MRSGAIPESLLERIAMAAGMVPTPFVDTFHAVISARAIVVSVKLGVFDACGSGPVTAEAMATALHVDVRALVKLLNLLVAIDYLSLGRGGYALTGISRKWLLSNSRQSLRDNLLLRFLEWQAIDRIEDFVRAGEGLDVHSLIKDEQWDTYQRGMRSIARLSAGEVSRRVPLGRDARTMLDIGGGHGTYSVAFCRRHKRLTATILDLPRSVEAAAPLLAEEAVGDRIRHKVGDAISEDLGLAAWDMIFVSHLVHHFTDDENRSLVIRSAAALRPGGVLAILDVLRPERADAAGGSGAFLDLYFGVTSSSGTWSRSEVDQWFEAAGLRSRKPISLRTAPGISVLVASRP